MAMPSKPLTRDDLETDLGPEEEEYLLIPWGERHSKGLDAMTVAKARILNANLNREKRRLEGVLKEIDNAREQIARATGGSGA